MSINKLKFQIITPEKVVFKDEIDSITLPTVDGEITVLPNHIPLISVTKPGEIMIRKDGAVHHMVVMSGFMETSENRVRLMTDAAELAEEIDERRAEEARDRAQKILEEKTDDVQYADASAMLERSLARLKVARRKHTNRSKTI